MKFLADICRLGDDESVATPLLESGFGTDSYSVNGRFLIDLPPGVRFVQPINPEQDVFGDNFLGALYSDWAKKAGYVEFVYNPLVNSSTGAAIDPAGVFVVDGTLPPVVYNTRAQLGRSGAGSANGLAPGGVVVLPANRTVTPSRPGTIVTRGVEAGRSVSRVRAVWSGYLSSTSEDEAVLGGPNLPAIRTMREIDPDGGELEVYVSVTGGGGWVRAVFDDDLLFDSPGASIRLAFLNRGTDRIHLNSYAFAY